MRAIVVGAAVVDLSFNVPRMPTPGDVIMATGFGQFLGGKGFNQAVALARLGVDVTFITALGTDAFGATIMSSLNANCVDTSRIVRLTEHPTSVAVPLVTPDGDVGFVHMPGANAHLGPDNVRDLPEADILLLQCEVPIETSLAAGHLVTSRGGSVFVNPAPAHDVPAALLDLADIICANELEAAALGDGSAASLATDGRQAVVTLGARGAEWSDGQKIGTVSALPAVAIDATGAGDAFCAALVVRLLEGASLADATRFACAAGAHAVTERGAEPGLPTRAQIEALL